MFSRNEIYITKEQQEKIKNTRILLGGAGLGSVIAEAALRLGFLNFTIIDADVVEKGNLNRQNYLNSDIGISKVEALAERLKAINPEVNLNIIKVYLDEKNVVDYLKDCDIAINAVDFSTDVPFIFDKICIDKNIPVVHPFNLGWAGFVFVVTSTSKQIYDLPNKYKHFEFTIIDHVANWVEKYQKQDLQWINNFREEYWSKQDKSPPQLSVASYITAGITASVLFSIANDLKIKTFPEPYFLSTR